MTTRDELSDAILAAALEWKSSLREQPERIVLIHKQAEHGDAHRASFVLESIEIGQTAKRLARAKIPNMTPTDALRIVLMRITGTPAEHYLERVYQGAGERYRGTLGNFIRETLVAAGADEGLPLADEVIGR